MDSSIDQSMEEKMGPYSPIPDEMVAALSRFSSGMIGRTILRRNVGRKVKVLHPTGSNTYFKEWEVVIDTISLFSCETGGIRHEDIVFRGYATTGTWGGEKTFFSCGCAAFTDLASGQAVADVAGWLRRMAEPS